LTVDKVTGIAVAAITGLPFGPPCSCNVRKSFTYSSQYARECRNTWGENGEPRYDTCPNLA